jgi:hypothetical protein
MERAMDLTNPEMWKQEWTAFWSAPFIMLAGIMAVGVAAWWFSKKIFEGQVAGLKEQVAAAEQRLKFATEQMAASVRATDELEREIQSYKDGVFLEGRMASSANLDEAIKSVEESNARIKDAVLAAAIKLSGEPLDPEVVKELERLGWPIRSVDGDNKDDE